MDEQTREHFQNDDKELHARSRKLLIAFTLASIFLVIAGIWSLIRYQRSVFRATPASSVERTMPEVTNTQPSEYWRLQPFQIALLGPERTTAQLSVTIGHPADPAIKKELAKREAQIREIILFTVQGKPRAFLIASNGKEELRNELKISINRVMRRPISDISITELVLR